MNIHNWQDLLSLNIIVESIDQEEQKVEEFKGYQIDPNEIMQ